MRTTLTEYINKATYQLKYIDSEYGVPTLLTRERYERFKDDLSVEKIRINPFDSQSFIVEP